MSTPDVEHPRPGDRFVSRRGLGPDFRHYAVVTVTAVRRRNGRSVVYYSGDGVGRAVSDLDRFAAQVRDPAGSDGDPDDPPVRS